jgi:UDP-N-acetylmuramyl pentapeptide phosphotransferase/UDP-N-acetylglucosamine-1-phosphate transferase
MSVSVIALIAFLLSLGGVEFFRRWSLARRLLDVPNERSSHKSPTPRGAGVVIVAVTLLVYLSGSLFEALPIDWSYVIGAVLVSGISWVDDLRSVPFGWRLLVHSAAAVLLILFLETSVTLPVSSYGGSIYTSYAAYAVAFLWVVWMINAYNFMDGIDGIAGSQAVIAGLGWLVVGIIGGNLHALLLGTGVAAASLGFLIHNWPPARVFMGDVGSAFLGFTFAALPLLLMKNGEGSIFAAQTPLLGAAFVWPFVLDTLATLVHRLIRGEKVWKAHREHYYQRLVIAGRSHSSVTVLYTVLAALTTTVGLATVGFGGNSGYFLVFTLVLVGVFLLLAPGKKTC